MLLRLRVSRFYGPRFTRLARQYTAPTHDKTPIEDPSRPGVYYHLVSAPNPISPYEPAFAVSFLPSTPSPGSSTPIGYLPAKGEGEESGLSDFVGNAGFLDLMHSTIQRALAEPKSSGTIEAEALQRGEGWMNINDERNIPPLGRVGDPDDIIATVRVEGGRILPETYQRMPSYRLATSDGLTKLPEELMQALLSTLKKQHDREQHGLGERSSS